jgi:hypothetical protein
MRFLGMTESIGPMWFLTSKPNPGSEAVPPPVGRPRAQVKERVGRITPSSSSAMSSDRLILDRVGRHQSPSPLHRHTQINMHFSESGVKGDVSTLPGWGHFYFALTAPKKLLALTRRVGYTCSNILAFTWGNGAVLPTTLLDLPRLARSLTA